jgi:hypothetical protein
VRKFLKNIFAFKDKHKPGFDALCKEISSKLPFKKKDFSSWSGIYNVKYFMYAYAGLSWAGSNPVSLAHIRR